MFGTITTGAESDIQQLTQIARGMVGRWGMSAAIGPIAVLPQEENGPLLPGSQPASETTQRLVDEEVRRIVEESYAEVRRLLTEHRDQLDSLTEALLRDGDARRGRRPTPRLKSRTRHRRYLARRNDRNFRACAQLKARRNTAEPPRPCAGAAGGPR